jgi:hypothetical protein
VSEHNQTTGKDKPISRPGYSSNAIAAEFERLLHQPHLSREEQNKLGAHISNEIVKRAGLRLRPEDLPILISDPNDDAPCPGPQTGRVMAAIDREILELALELGPQIYESLLVRGRMRTWYAEASPQRGIERFRKLNAAIEQCLATLIGEVKRPVLQSEVRLKANKKQCVPEFVYLFKQRRAYLASSHVKPDLKEAFEWYRRTIQQSNRCYFLQGQVLILLDYVANANRKIRLDFIMGKVTAPASFFDGWGAWCRNLDQDTFRQQVSRLPEPPQEV